MKSTTNVTETTRLKHHYHSCNSLVVTQNGISYSLHDTEKKYYVFYTDERHGNLPQGNQEPLVVRDKVGKPQVGVG